MLSYLQCVHFILFFFNYMPRHSSSSYSRNSPSPRAPAPAQAPAETTELAPAPQAHQHKNRGAESSTARATRDGMTPSVCTSKWSVRTLKRPENAVGVRYKGSPPQKKHICYASRTTWARKRANYIYFMFLLLSLFHIILLLHCWWRTGGRWRTFSNFFNYFLFLFLYI